MDCGNSLKETIRKEPEGWAARGVHLVYCGILHPKRVQKVSVQDNETHKEMVDHILPTF